MKRGSYLELALVAGALYLLYQQLRGSGAFGGARRAPEESPAYNTAWSGALEQWYETAAPGGIMGPIYYPTPGYGGGGYGRY